MSVLLATPAFTLTTDASTPVVRFTRTALAYISIPDFERLHDDAARVLDKLGRTSRVLLVDMRLAVLNNDPEFEKASVRVRPLLLRGFLRAAVLVRTAVGALQINRHMREDRTGVPVFQDEKAAIEFLRYGPLDEEPPPSDASGVETKRPSSRRRSGAFGR